MESWFEKGSGTECIFQFQSEVNKIKGIFCDEKAFMFSLNHVLQLNKIIQSKKKLHLDSFSLC